MAAVSGVKRPRADDKTTSAKSSAQQHSEVLSSLRRQCKFLTDWFQHYGGDTLYEIEVKVKDVDKDTFEHMRKKLESFNDWKSRTVTDSTDIKHSNGVRGTIVTGQQPTFLVKKKVGSHKDVNIDDDDDIEPELLRFTCNTEERVGQPRDDCRAVNFRIKRRYTFNRKGEFSYDLTEVRSGGSMEAAQRASTVYEVELEWCGAAAARGYLSQGGPQLLVEKFLMKAADLVVMKREAQLTARQQHLPNASASRSNIAAAVRDSASSTAASDHVGKKPAESLDDRRISDVHAADDSQARVAGQNERSESERRPTADDAAIGIGPADTTPASAPAAKAATVLINTTL